jgi:hypothetical protein
MTFDTDALSAGRVWAGAVVDEPERLHPRMQQNDNARAALIVPSPA